MASIYARGGKLWCRVKNESGRWISKATPFSTGDEAKALRYAQAAQREVDGRRAHGATDAPLTIRQYAEKWLAERRKRGVRSVEKERSRLVHHVLPVLGAMRLDAVRPRDVRDLVRDLRAKDELAPRTISHCYGDLHGVFRDAVVDELIEHSPCVLGRGELPQKLDKDPEWRNAATYTAAEVERLISDPALSIENRVRNAFKALAGLRHGEAAGLRWRHVDATATPLGRLTIATSYDNGTTKTGVTRSVPIHPVLAKILAEWKLSHWERIYGRAAGLDDLVVGTPTGRPISACESAAAFKADLRLLGLRVEAGKHRDRGGHDLRSWFITTAQECGAHRDLLRVVTHTSRGDIVSGYTRASWSALCAEVAKLKVAIRKGDLLELATLLATPSGSSRNRSSIVVGVVGVEPLGMATVVPARPVTSGHDASDADASGPERTDRVASLATALAAAVLDGDHERARTLAAELHALDGAAVPVRRNVR